MQDSLIQSILQSQSAWTNFWTFSSGLAGALAGGGITYYFQNRSESYKVSEERKGMLCKYSLFIDRIYWMVKQNHDDQLEPRKDDPIRHINIPAIHAVFPEVDIKDPAIELFFLAELNEVDVIGYLLNLKQRYIGFVDFEKIRNELIVGQLQEIVARHDLQNRAIPKNEVMNYVGQPLYGKLESATNTIYADTKYILENSEKAKAELKRIFKKMFPKGKMVELFNK